MHFSIYYSYSILFYNLYIEIPLWTLYILMKQLKPFNAQWCGKKVSDIQYKYLDGLELWATIPTICIIIKIYIFIYKHIFMYIHTNIYTKKSHWSFWYFYALLLRSRRGNSKRRKQSQNSTRLFGKEKICI